MKNTPRDGDDRRFDGVENPRLPPAYFLIGVAVCLLAIGATFI